MKTVLPPINLVFLFLFLTMLSPTYALDVESIRMSADAEIQEVWIDGQSPGLGANSANWRMDDDYGPRQNLTSIAVKAVSSSSTGVHSGFIAAILVDENRVIVTDNTWKAHVGEPPPDSQGRAWTHPDYDDSAWPYATELGPYGIGPWGTNNNGADSIPPQSQLDAAFRLTQAPVLLNASRTALDWRLPPPPNIVQLYSFFGGTSYQIWNANWIWSGPGLPPAASAYFRKSFVGGQGIPPDRPQNIFLSNVQPDGFRVVWRPCFSAQGLVRYEVVWNGLKVLTTDQPIAEVRGISITPAAQNYVYVVPVAPDGTRGRASQFLLVKLPDTEAPKKVENFRIVSRTSTTISLAWDPVEDNVGNNIYVILAGGTFNSVPGHLGSATINVAATVDESSITIRAVDTSSNQGPTSNLTIPPSSPPVVNPPAAVPPNPDDVLLRFVTTNVTDSNWDLLRAALNDGLEKNCSFALVQGSITIQLSGSEVHWQNARQVKNEYDSENFKVLFNPLAVKDQWPVVNDATLTWTSDAWELLRSIGRYDRFLQYIEQPLNRVSQELDGAFRLATFVGDPRSNPDFPYLLERAVHEAEADPSVRWLFTGGLQSESYPMGIAGIILNLHRPTIEFMRMINGNRGHELDFRPGQNIVCASPQRNRAGGWYLVEIEDQRIVLTARRLVNGSVITEGVEEIRYDRRNNFVAVPKLRVPHPSGIESSPPILATTGPVWTQNQILTTPVGVPLSIQPLGRSTRGAPLSFKVIQPSRNGTLSSKGAGMLYTPNDGFVGEDFFLYQADDGGPLPGNTGWVRISVITP